MTDKPQRPVPKYPNAFLFGSVAGCTLQLVSHTMMGEALASRPFSYVRAALLFGVGISMWDHWRRDCLQTVLRAEHKARHHY